ncbi:hypothetical protein BX616_000165 [Lobosporangium transversale]|uniref:Uncharacterized protein n=1 Tax=Lobosporangium transversale TaxID=64571 RepID=A0A1Y2GEC3_9FUNG|nr:hypothetical protein BCR41DRAFT_359333 [Lobosporangium transversale]KAF9908423.1 hypothetical protein BX616_000165 [Lobosporangium transversale]ORZ08519.1 hypothetical protein BCR41DRAFT_359333 [Lobosporangium transversale]|eukprot:XP_021878447.1 hypothetical protein BCR41DRAFT_359333 [Lobosporangium transversale]
MSEIVATKTSHQKRLKYGIIAVIGVLGSARLFYYFGWSSSYSAETAQSPLNTITRDYPLDPAETDRACMLLDRPFNSATQPDFTKSPIRQWTECRSLKTIPGWSVQHCTVPGSTTIIQEEDEAREDEKEQPTSAQCYPGGYFRIQRLQARIGDTLLETEACQPKPNTVLAKDPTTNLYTSRYLGPDTFRIVLIGPERISLLQQQPLGGCTYAIPYLISRPGRFWVQKILHTYQGYDALNENMSSQWTPEYLNTDLIAEETRQSQRFYQFNVCSHCVAWVAIDEAEGLGGTQDICSNTPSTQSRQYGIYSARLPIESLWQAVSHPYEWIPARPRCRFYPAQTAFEPVDESDSEEVKAEKEEAAKCLQLKRSIYFVGDSHVRVLFSGLMQRLQGRSGKLDAPIQDRKSHVLKIGNIVARSDFDPSLNETLARIRYSANGQEDDKVNVPDLAVLNEMDTVVVGFGSFAGHWTTAQFIERIKAILDGLVELRKMRQAVKAGAPQDKMSSLKVIWMGLPAWTDNTAADQRDIAGWKTNHRILYWNKLVDGMIDNINAQVGGHGMIDRLSTFEITVPFKNITQDHLHFTTETPVDSLSAELIHKLVLCS